MSNNATEEIRELSVLPMAVQTRAAAIPKAQAEAMVPAIAAMWPKEVEANPVLARAVARVALAYGLDPLMNEIIIYQGKPYITIDGRMRKAQEQPQYQGLEARPATAEERKAYCARDDDTLWRCEAYRSDWKRGDGSLRPAVGWGLVRRGDHEKNYIAKSTPELIAEKRSKARALRDLFAVPLPSAEDLDEGIPQPPKWIDPATGEVLDTRPGGMLANQGQIAAVHAMCKGLGIDENSRHNLLIMMYHKSATNELTEGEAASFLEWLGVKAAEDARNAPEAIEARAREQAYPVESRAASLRYRTPQPARPEPEQPAHDAEAEPEMSADEPEMAEPEADANEEVTEGELDTGIVLPPAIANALSQIRAHWFAGEAAPPWSTSKRTNAIKGARDQLTLHDYRLAQADALFALLHFGATGEILERGPASNEADARVFIAVQEMTTPQLEALKQAADWWVAQGRGAAS